MQFQIGNLLVGGRRPHGLVRGIHDDRLQIGGLELPQFNEYLTAIFAKRRMSGSRRVAYVSSCRVVTMLIRKDAVENQELLPQSMFMTCKRTIRCIANDTGSTCNLVANPVEHDPIDTMFGRVNPLLIGRKQPGRSREVGIYTHSCHSITNSCRGEISPRQPEDSLPSYWLSELKRSVQCNSLWCRHETIERVGAKCGSG